VPRARLPCKLEPHNAGLLFEGANRERATARRNRTWSWAMPAMTTTRGAARHERFPGEGGQQRLRGNTNGGFKE